MFKFSPLGEYEEMKEDTFESILHYGTSLWEVKAISQPIVKDYLNDCIKAHNGKECSMKFNTKMVYL
jgi:hypothetical protein